MLRPVKLYSAMLRSSLSQLDGFRQRGARILRPSFFDGVPNVKLFCSQGADSHFAERNMLNLEFVRREIRAHARAGAKTGEEILQLQRAGLSAASAEVLLGRMKVKIWGLIA